ncbi:hypothetical protein BFL37_04080 [Clavibacter michiganensis]|uniref:Uncharacterized protein n=1 Tax=Clavibacter michiganensis TaxID=28447 RepID=A0A251YT11_9MICO|nr:hypothetical protein BFL37_04080 [Clavibacter michiganensis]
MAGLASAGALLLQPGLLGGSRIQPTPDMASAIVLQGPVVDVVVLVLVVAAAVVLARGVRGEPGLLQASRAAGIAALVAAGAQVAFTLARILVGLMLGDPPGSAGLVEPPVVVVLSQGVYAVHVGALAVLGVLVVRGRLLEPLARLCLLVVGTGTAASWILGQTLGLLLAGAEASPLIPLLFALPPVILVASAGLVVGLLVHGRSAAMRARVETIRRAW